MEGHFSVFETSSLILKITDEIHCVAVKYNSQDIKSMNISAFAQKKKSLEITWIFGSLLFLLHFKCFLINFKLIENIIGCKLTHLES